MASRLPPELILAILKIFKGAAGGSLDASSLRAVALVARAWRGPAQQLLHDDVFLSSQSVADAWLADHCPGITVTRLVLGRMTEPSAHAVLSAGREMEPEELVLALGVTLTDHKLLLHPNLKSLKRLTLRTPLFVPLEAGKRPPIVLPFALSHIVLVSVFLSDSILSALLVSSTLRSLDLAYVTVAFALPAFKAIAPNLTHLSFPSDHGVLNHYLPLLPICTSLQSFSCAIASEKLLAVLPDHVRSVRVRAVYDIATIQKTLDRLETIKEVRLPRVGLLRNANPLVEQREKEAMASMCRKRGARLWFGDNEWKTQ